MELAAAVADRDIGPAAAGSWDTEAPLAAMGNPAEVGAAGEDIVVADIVVVAIH